MDDLLEDRLERMEEEDRFNRWREVTVREVRQLQDHTNPLTKFSDKDFKRHFRFTKENFLKLVDIVDEELSVTDG